MRCWRNSFAPCSSGKCRWRRRRWIAVLEILDATLTRVAANYAELLAPAVDRVWQDEIAEHPHRFAHLGAGACREHGMGAVVVRVWLRPA